MEKEGAFLAKDESGHIVELKMSKPSFFDLFSILKEEIDKSKDFRLKNFGTSLFLEAIEKLALSLKQKNYLAHSLFEVHCGYIINHFTHGFRCLWDIPVEYKGISEDTIKENQRTQLDLLFFRENIFCGIPIEVKSSLTLFDTVEEENVYCPHNINEIDPNHIVNFRTDHIKIDDKSKFDLKKATPRFVLLVNGRFPNIIAIFDMQDCWNKFVVKEDSYYLPSECQISINELVKRMEVLSNEFEKEFCMKEVLYSFIKDNKDIERLLEYTVLTSSIADNNSFTREPLVPVAKEFLSIVKTFKNVERIKVDKNIEKLVLKNKKSEKEEDKVIYINKIDFSKYDYKKICDNDGIFAIKHANRLSCIQNELKNYKITIKEYNFLHNILNYYANKNIKKSEKVYIYTEEHYNGVYGMKSFKLFDIKTQSVVECREFRKVFKASEINPYYDLPRTDKEDGGKIKNLPDLLFFPIKESEISEKFSFTNTYAIVTKNDLLLAEKKYIKNNSGKKYFPTLRDIEDNALLKNEVLKVDVIPVISSILGIPSKEMSENVSIK